MSDADIIIESRFCHGTIFFYIHLVIQDAIHETGIAQVP